MTGYVRQSIADILPGEEVRAEPLNAEFNRLVAAFSASTGHTHDGSEGGGPPLNLTTSITGVLPVANGGTGGNTLDSLKTALSLGTAAYTSISNYATASQGTKADGALQRSGGTMTGAINMGGFGLSNVGTIALNNQKITGMAAPTADTDAATRKFVLDTLASVDTSGFAAHVNNLNNPHQVTKAQVGLGNVDNQSIATILSNSVLTGIPIAPTAPLNTNTTQVATTSFVQSALGTIPPTPAILPIEMTAPASGATDVGAGGTYTFVARAFVGDNIGFYSNYGVPVASRFVNVYEPGATTPIKTFSATGGGPSLVANFTGSGLVVSHAYQFEFGYTDAQGNTVKSPKVSATTASQFKPSEGQAYQGGFLAFQNFGDGDLFDLVVAPKSTEASRVWDSGSQGLLSIFSRMNGPNNTTRATAAGSILQAATYASSTSIGGVAGYLGAIDELRAISSKLKPSAAVEAAFKTGGAEAFTSTTNWSSTEVDASTAVRADMFNGTEGNNVKTGSFSVRAIKRVSTITPYPIGTAMEGGFLAAYFTDLSSGSPVTYMLIVADKATEVTRQWDYGSSGLLAGSTAASPASRTNGKAITEDPYVAGRANFAAYNYCGILTSGSKSDWYLGAIDEMLAIARMNSQLPSAQRLATSSFLWTSTEVDASQSKVLSADNGGGVPAENIRSKDGSWLVRPIRRVLLPAT